MKIKWIDGQKEVPNLGVLNTGDVRDVPVDVAQNLIKQGQAKQLKKKTKKTGTKKEG